MKTARHRKNLETASIGVIGLVSASAAHASSIATNVSAQNLTISTNSDGGGTIYFDLDRSGSAPYAGFSTGAVSGYDFSIRPNADFNGKPTVVATDFNSVLNNKFSSGALIGAETGTWETTAELTNIWSTGPWNGTNGEGYLGLRMSAGGSDYRYGWALLDYESDADQISLKSFGYETALNQSIRAEGISAIPEPGNMSMLAALLSGSVLLRSRRRMVRQDPHGI